MPGLECVSSEYNFEMFFYTIHICYLYVHGIKYCMFAVILYGETPTRKKNKTFSDVCKVKKNFFFLMEMFRRLF